VEEHSRPKDDEFIPTRQSLLSRLRDWRDGESWQEFFDNYWRLIYGAAVKAGLTDAEAQDVVQETLISVSKSMPQFHYDPRRGSFKGWLLQLTGWRIADQFAKRLPEKRPPSRGRDSATGTALLDQIADPESVNLEALWDEEWEKNIMVIAIERARRKVDPKQYQIFDYCVLKGLPVPRVAAALHVNRGRVYLVKHRITKLIKKEVAILMARPF
jgi:RNA polymerase sigma-70 factor (ECF subfamily)